MEKTQRLLQDFKTLAAQHQPITLKKKATTHVWRERKESSHLDALDFNNVLKVNAQEMTVEVEGGVTYWDLVQETLKHGFLPNVIPELRHITVGGTVSGLGVESSSFKFGMVHENIVEMDVLVGNGEIITCSPSVHSDLFYAMPNSWGSMGYVLRAVLKLQKAKKYVKVKYERFTNATDYFAFMKETMGLKGSDIDFIDGVVFSPTNYVCVIGTFTDETPSTTPPDFVNEVFYKHIQDTANSEYSMLSLDYIWRWDRDAFWSTDQPIIRNLFHNSLLRKYLGKYILRSDRLGELRLKRNQIKKLLKPILPKPKTRSEQIIQDVGVEIDSAATFMDWYQSNICIFPLWLCPIKQSDEYYPLYHWKGEYIIDIGFYYSIDLKESMAKNHYNRLIESKLIELGGMKGLHAKSYYTKDEFWAIYDKNKYDSAKFQYDSNGVFPDLYDKVVGDETY